MKFSELKCCPFCGGEEFYRKEYAYGSLRYLERFDGAEADNSEFYESLNFKSYSDRTYCRSCNRYLGNKENDTVCKSLNLRVAKEKRGDTDEQLCILHRRGMR